MDGGEYKEATLILQTHTGKEQVCLFPRAPLKIGVCVLPFDGFSAGSNGQVRVFVLTRPWGTTQFLSHPTTGSGL